MKAAIYTLLLTLLGITYSCQAQQKQGADGQQDSIRSERESYTLTFVGDIMVHGPQIAAARRSNKTYDFVPSFSAVDSILSQANLTIGNLETTFAGRPYRGYPLFSAPDELGEALKNVGFDVLTTSNNHAADRGKQGIIRTLDRLQTLGIASVGSYRNKKDREHSSPLIIELGTLRVALMAYTYGTNGIPVEQPTWIDPIDTTLIFGDLQRADSLRANYKIVQIHWGEEYQASPNKRQKDLALWLHQQGVDAIIGSHPHVVQDAEFLYNESNSQKTFVIYSLGNFISNQRTPAATRGGMILNLRLERDNKQQKFTTTPSYQWVFVNKRSVEGDSVYRLLPVDITSNAVPQTLHHEEKQDYKNFCLYYRNIRLSH